ncbi:MAG TPA: sugar transferase [Ktedonobacterales bacterium]|nr:sugar transferase [Ktedonobacterales bacterium]
MPTAIEIDAALDKSSTTYAKHRRSRRPRFPVSERRVLLMLGDLVASVAAIVLSLWLWAQHAHHTFDPEFVKPQWHWFIILPTLWLALANANDYYNLRVAARLSSSLKRLTLVTAELLLIYLGIFFLSPRGSLPRRFIVYYAVASLAFTGVWRACRLFLIGWTGFRRRALIVGAGRSAEMIKAALVEEASADYEVVGVVSSEHDFLALTGGNTSLGTGADLPSLVWKLGINELIVAYVNEVPDDIFQGVMTCYEQGISIVPMPVLYEQVTGRIPIEHVGSHLWSLVLPIEGHSLPTALYQAVKRALDLILAVIGLLVFALLLPFLALAIKLDSPGPVFYRQKRLGQAGRPFTVVKLRSMVMDAERNTGPRWARVRDPRVTRVGKLLRKTRMDELPQVINVLRGEMAVVGPRPERPEFVTMLALEIPFYRTRLAVKPGLTGWAQVRYRYGASAEDALKKLQYDLYYVRHQSLVLDTMIILRTVGTMLMLRGT